MKTIFHVFIIIFVSCISCVAQDNKFDWGKTLRGGENEGYSIFSDHNGNSYITGYFKGTVDFDPDTAKVYYLISGYSQEAYILKLDSQGKFVWVKQIKGNNNDCGKAVTVDRFGNIFTLGYFNDSADFDPGPGKYTLKTVGKTSIFILKLDSQGNFNWAREIAGSEIPYSESISTDAKGDIYFSGHFSGYTDFDPGVAKYVLHNIGLGDMFIEKLDSGGNFKWVRTMGKENQGCNAISICADSIGNSYFTGLFYDTLDFNGGKDSFILTADGGSMNSYIEKVDKNGNFIWVKQLRSNTSVQGNSITIDKDGDILTAGTFWGTADFDPDTSSYILSGIRGNLFVQKMDSSGKFKWAECSYAGNHSSYASSLSTDSKGFVYVAGSFDNQIYFDTASTKHLVQSGKNNIDGNFLVWKLDKDGKFNWVKSLDVEMSTYYPGISIRCDANDNILSIGFHEKPFDVDPGIDSFILEKDSNNNQNMFILKLGSSYIMTGIEKTNKKPEINIYPNPFKDNFVLEMNGSLEKSRIEIRDLFGRMILNKNLDGSDSMNIDFPYPAGIYLVSVISNGQANTFKLIKE